MINLKLCLQAIGAVAKSSPPVCCGRVSCERTAAKPVLFCGDSSLEARAESQRAAPSSTIRKGERNIDGTSDGVEGFDAAVERKLRDLFHRCDTDRSETMGRVE